ncbi:MAG: hypothetical protein PHZ26_04730 [Candidatus Gracilibacteria bacterium]|nr:hypothetical protein [Candidatus Gracilibacteria bacterium]MDD2909033.1 hypothetical protein [Candidatus Gracilibacteria bacterium]
MAQSNFIPSSHSSNVFALDGIGIVDISIPKYMELYRIVNTAIKNHLGIPCLTEDGSRALLALGEIPISKPTIRIISITQQHLNHILSLTI